MGNILLPALIAVPFITGFLCWLLDKAHSKLPKWIALIGTTIMLALSLALWQSGNYQFNAPESGAPQWAAEFVAAWMPSFGISFHLAADGLSLLMVALTALLGVMAVACSWSEIQKNEGFFYLNLLWSLAGVIGVFLALDMFLFVFFWEMMLIPIYFLIALWGHKGSSGMSRVGAAVKFFIYTQVSGLVMIVGVLALVIVHYVQQLQINPNAQISFNYMDLLGTQMPMALEYGIMLCFFIGFAVKLPIFPFHGWLPDAHAQAPTAGSVDLAGILIKTAAYGFLRFAIPFFPNASAAFADVAIVLGLIGIFYGAWCAYQQTDLKRLLAYTSISHMGFIVLAIYAGTIVSYQGIMIMMLAHGLSSAALFIMCGQIYERLHTRDMRLMGGMRGQFQFLSFFLTFFFVALVGIPGLGNFMGEYLILMGSFAHFPVFTIIATASLVWAGLYGLIMLHRTLFGTPNPEQQPKIAQPLKDLSAREMAVLLVAAVGLIWLGLHPQTVLDISGSSLDWIANHGIYSQSMDTAVQPVVSSLQPMEIQ